MDEKQLRFFLVVRSTVLQQAFLTNNAELNFRVASRLASVSYRAYLSDEYRRLRHAALAGDLGARRALECGEAAAVDPAPAGLRPHTQPPRLG